MFRKYYSTDTGAPVISNTLGTLCTALDAILVTGYPTESITGITRVGTTVTVNKTGHGRSVGQAVSISGATQEEYNGLVQVATIVDANNWTYEIATTPATPATGVIIANTVAGKPGLGWQGVFTGTNKRAYRPRTGTRMYLRVAHDTNTHNAQVRGFETMSDVDTGTGPFPTVAQLASGVHWQTTNAVAGNRSWVAHGDEKQISIACPAAAVGSHYSWCHFGDFESYKPGDAYNCMLIGKSVSTTAVETSDVFSTLNNITGAAQKAAGIINGHYVVRGPSQIGSSVQVGKYPDIGRAGNGSIGQGTPGDDMMTYPGPVDGAVHISSMWVTHPAAASGGTRGRMRGLWVVCHQGNQMGTAGVADGDTINATDGVSVFVGEIRRTANAGGGSGPLGLILETPT